MLILSAGLPIIQRTSLANDHHPLSHRCHPLRFPGQCDHHDAFHPRHHQVQCRRFKLHQFFWGSEGEHTWSQTTVHSQSQLRVILEKWNLLTCMFLDLDVLYSVVETAATCPPPHLMRPAALLLLSSSLIRNWTTLLELLENQYSVLWPPDHAKICRYSWVKLTGKTARFTCCQSWSFRAYKSLGRRNALHKRGRVRYVFLAFVTKFFFLVSDSKQSPSSIFF